MTLDFTTEQFHYDSTTASFAPCQDDLMGGQDETVESFERDAQQAVTLPAGSPWAEAFDTRDFYRISATVAKPIAQPYIIDGEQYTFKKPADELKKSVAWLENKPFVLGHPASKTVKARSQVHGFWRNAKYVEDADELQAQVYIPATDMEALDWVETYTDVSVGFYNQLEQAPAEADVDAYQTNIYYDHVAGVRQGRCSEEDGCGLEIDGADAIEVCPCERPTEAVDDGDAAQTQMTAGETVTQSDGSGAETSSTAEDNSPDAGDETASSTLDSDSTMTDTDSDEATTDCGCDGTEDNGVELDSLSLDDLAEQHEGVAEVVDERDELDAEIDSLTEDKNELQERVEALQEKLDEKQAALDEYKTEEKRELVDEILDHSSYWDEDALIDKDMDTLEENLEIVKDAAASDTTANPTTDSQETEQTGSRRKLDLSDK